MKKNSKQGVFCEEINLAMRRDGCRGGKYREFNRRHFTAQNCAQRF